MDMTAVGGRPCSQAKSVRGPAMCSVYVYSKAQAPNSATDQESHHLNVETRPMPPVLLSGGSILVNLNPFIQNVLNS